MSRVRSNSDLERIREETASPASFDDLFAELKQELKNNTTPRDSKLSFEQIQREVESVPHLDDFDESTLATKSSKSLRKPSAKSQNVVIEDDPVIKYRSNKQENIQKGAGDKWFNMPKTEITPEIKRDLTIIQNRAALDPKRFYKKDKWKVPEYFQMGTVLSNADGVIEGRTVGRAKSKGIVDEIIHDEKTQKYFKRKYQEIQEKATSGRKDHYRKLREKRKKF